jgi:hypothetical protein
MIEQFKFKFDQYFKGLFQIIKLKYVFFLDWVIKIDILKVCFLSSLNFFKKNVLFQPVRKTHKYIIYH